MMANHDNACALNVVHIGICSEKREIIFFYGQIACKFGNIFHGFDLYKGSTI